MSSRVALPGENAPTDDAAPRASSLNWRWSVEAVKAALAAAGTPPNLDIQSMLNAAFAVDGPALTGEVFAVLIGDRVRELDAAPFLLDTRGVAEVECSGHFMLLLMTGRTDLLPSRRIVTSEDADQRSLVETDDAN